MKEVELNRLDPIVIIVIKYYYIDIIVIKIVRNYGILIQKEMTNSKEQS